MATRVREIKDQNLINMFNQMISGDGDESIIAAKLVTIRASIKRLNGIFTNLINPTSPFVRQFPEYATYFEEIAKWNTLNAPLLDEKLTYRAIKENDQTRQLVIIAADLREHAHHLENRSDRWLVIIPGLTYMPFKFTGLDMKHIWANPSTTEGVKQYLLLTLKLIYVSCNEIYKTLTSPDINTSHFSTAIVESLERFQSIPELSRCRGAFRKIRESIDLLNNNFGEYYKDMVQSKNPNTIIESFVMDVSKQSAMTPDLMRQFNDIIRAYRKSMHNRPKNASTQKLMDSLHETMSKFGHG